MASKFFKDGDKNVVPQLIRGAKPRITIIVAWIIALSILSIGCAWSYQVDDWNIFARSGSLLVFIALVVASINFNGWSKNNYQFIGGVVAEKANSQEDPGIREILEKTISTSDTMTTILFSKSLNENLNEKLNEIGLSIPNKHRKLLVSFLIDQQAQLMMNLTDRHIKEKVQKHELLVAALGTLVWGFGDLL